MVFKRRDRRSIWRILLEVLWPRGGWGRAATYVQHRLRRLPDSPEKIARGMFCGIFASFTPFYGLHFVLATFLAIVFRGNVLASLLSTFFGNPLTYVPIGVVSLKTGYLLLGQENAPAEHGTLAGKFVRAGEDLWLNFKSCFTPAEANWQHLSLFYDEVFFPYMIGCIIPGIIVGVVGYYVTVPIIRAYQSRRKGALKAKLAALKKKKQADARKTSD